MLHTKINHKVKEIGTLLESFLTENPFSFQRTEQLPSNTDTQNHRARSFASFNANAPKQVLSRNVFQRRHENATGKHFLSMEN